MRKSSFMSGTALLALCLAAAPALAQSSDVETVTVSGYRGSLAKAQDFKHDSVGSEDSIFSEDIAQFPELNLAESLQRIPGIAITRDAGEGRQITLRGLGPDFTRTQLNGMEVLSNTASGMDNRGNVSRTRSFDFSMFASELFNRITVQKSYAADQDEGGIAGTVQLYTPEPFDYDGFKAVVSAKGLTNSNTGTVTPRLVGLVSDRWGDFGALVSVAYSTNDANEYGYRNWGWSQITVQPKNIGPGVSAADAARLESTSPATQLFAPQADTYSTWFTHRERLGVTSALQWQPADNLSFSLDGLYGHLKNNRNDYALAAAGTNALTGNVSGTQLLNSVTIQGNTIEAANWSHVDMRSEYNQENDTTDFYQLSGHADWQVTQDFGAKLMLGYSRSNYVLPTFDKVFLESQNKDFAYDDRTPNPVNTYGFNIADPNQWNLMRMDTQENGITDDYVNGKLDFSWKLDDTSTITFGGEYKKFANSGFTRTNKVFRNAPADTVIPNNLKDLVPYDTVQNYVVGDVDATYAAIGQIRNLNPSFDVPGSDFEVVEKTLGGYVQYDLKTTLFGYGVRANLGVRYFSTDLSSAGMLNTGTTLVPVDILHHYNDLLPAGNLAVDITDEIVWRASANRNISRPALSDLAAAGSLTTAPFGGTISAGNPNLRPFMADSLETSLDYFDAHHGYASIGVFYKNMESFITTQTTVEPYSATGYPLSFLLPGQDGTVPYNYSAPINGHGAVIVGLEAAGQRDFDFLPAPFNHLGVEGNITYADGNTPVIFSSVPHSLPLTNLSKLTTNFTLYYEADSWGIRASDAYRSRYMDGAGGSGNFGDFVNSTNNV
ncbi:MAG: TonB-dependent receptor, partial [Mucilaginibacter sp.]|nr:TonB-dependent receptor [Mucilaginibacter sp.]